MYDKVVAIGATPVQHARAKGGDVAAEPSPTPPPTPGVPTGELEAMANQLKEFAALDWLSMPGAAGNDAIIAIEGVNRALAALQAEAVSAAEASGMWALDGHRTFTSWLTNNTGTKVGRASCRE